MKHSNVFEQITVVNKTKVTLTTENTGSLSLILMTETVKSLSVERAVLPPPSLACTLSCIENRIELVLINGHIPKPDMSPTDSVRFIPYPL